MGKLKRTAAFAFCLALIGAMCSNTLAQPASAEDLTAQIVIDKNTAQTSENKLYRGLGMISGNNSSRLLMDYKNENPEKYWEILNYIFGSDGLEISHLKVEMGSDINSSSGTEPAVKRTEDEKADVTRGAAYQLAADAKTINPDITLDMLCWSEPLWVSNAQDVYAARYKWFKETLDSAYETYGIKFDYVSAVQNERAVDTEWIKYLSAHLKSETDCPYDYSKIKIVAGDEVCTWNIADSMLEDEDLLNSVDVIGSHYTSWASDNAKKLADEYDKELWFSEASPAMSYSKSTYKYDGMNSGLADISGPLDIANRIITMYPGGEMTLYEFQPAVAAYYDGVTYCSKQLIKANEPWSGAYEFDASYYISLHFSKFIKKGWSFVESGCFADGKAGGDGHAIVDSTYSYMTACDTDSDDYSTVITNTTDKKITYDFTVKNLSTAGNKVYVWQTKGPDGGEYNENYFKKITEITPKKSGDGYTYSVTLQPYSIITLSTLDVEPVELSDSPSEILQLPYEDDYEYKDYSSDYLSSRGNMPRYTTDQGGAFEVCNVDGNNVVMQMITPDIKANEWGGSPKPTTNFGDDRWFNYSVNADVMLEKSDKPEDNYAGIGLRYNMASNGESGYWAKLYEDGSLMLMKNNTVLEKTQIEYSAENWINLKVEAVENNIKVYADDKLEIEYTCEDESLIGAGRAAYFSSYNNNCFDNFKASNIENTSAYITRYDDMDDLITYSSGWEFSTTGSYKNLNRTSCKGGAGETASFTFDGTGFSIGGATGAKTQLKITVDGETYDYTTVRSGTKEISYYLYGLEDTTHNVEIKIEDGSYNIDFIEILSSDSDDIEENQSQANSEPSENNESNDKIDNNSKDAESESKDETVEKSTKKTSSKSSIVNPKTGVIISSAAVIAAGTAVLIAAKKKKKK